MSDVSEDIVVLRKSVNSNAQRELARILGAYWHDDFVAQRDAQFAVERGRRELMKLLASAEQPAPHPHLEDLQNAAGELACESVRSILKVKSSVENLFLKAKASNDSVKRIQLEMKSYSKNPGSLAAKGTVARLYKETMDASNLVSDLAQDVLKFRESAAEFAAGSFDIFTFFDVGGLFDNLDDLNLLKMQLKKMTKIPRDVARRFLAKLGTWSSEKLSRFKKLYGSVGKVMLGVGIAIWVTTTVMQVYADFGNWSYHVATAAITLGAGMAVSAVVTASAVSSLITGFFSAASVTVEVPPVAAALAAAGIVILAGVAVAKLYELTVNLLFGGMFVRTPMRLTLSRGMIISLKKPLAKKLAKPLYPH